MMDCKYSTLDHPHTVVGTEPTRSDVMDFERITFVDDFSITYLAARTDKKLLNFDEFLFDPI